MASIIGAMSSSKRMHLLHLAAFAGLALSSPFFYGQRARFAAPTASALQQEVRADMSFLADDELHGRGSATRDEHIAALFAATQFQSLGLKPGGEDGTFLQKIALPIPLPARVQQHLSKFEDAPRKETWNAVAVLPGTTQADEVVLLT